MTQEEVSQPIAAEKRTWESLHRDMDELLEDKQRGTLVYTYKERNGKTYGPYLELAVTWYDVLGRKHQARYYLGKEGTKRAKDKFELAVDVMRGVLKYSYVDNSDVVKALDKAFKGRP